MKNNIEKIKIEARQAAWLYDKLVDACPYPFHSEEGRIFKAQFLETREQILALCPPAKDEA